MLPSFKDIQNPASPAGGAWGRRNTSAAHGNIPPPLQPSHIKKEGVRYFLRRAKIDLLFIFLFFSSPLRKRVRVRVMS